MIVSNAYIGLQEAAAGPAPCQVEGQGERLRSSLVILDVNLPSVALPDGVHCRAFTGAQSMTSYPGTAMSSMACMSGACMCMCW